MFSIKGTPRIIAASLAVGILAGAGLFGGLNGGGALVAHIPGLSEASLPMVTAQAPSAPAKPTKKEDLGDLPDRLSSVYTQLAQEVTPAVVRIESRRPAEQSGADIQDIPEPFRQFFNLPQGGQNPNSPPPEEMAGGSGFIVSPDGYIVTNAHVVEDADKVEVILRDRQPYDATIVGTDPTTDLAVIKIDEKNLPTISFGSSDQVQVGEPVMAVGNPGFAGTGSLDYTVTTGIVSAIGRPLSIIRQSLQNNPDLAGYAIENFVQTDAVINPGNSGGPLVNLRGEVVGVNSAIASTSGYYQGYGFAIPADLANRISHELIAHGKVSRGWLGVMVTGVTAEDAEAYGLPSVSGVLVQSVTDGSPAQTAGLQPEDVVVSVDGHKVQDAGDLQERVAELGPGQKANLEVYRGGKAQSITVKLGEAPIQATKEAPAKTQAETPEALLGLTVADLTPQMAREAGFSRAGGAVVTDVTAWSSAMEKGVTPGLKILEVNHKTVTNASGVRDALEGLKAGDIVTLLLQAPDGTTRIVNLRAEQG